MHAQQDIKNNGYSTYFDQKNNCRDLKLQPFKKIKGQQINIRTKEKRIERCPNLLRVFTKQVLETAFFSDEKIFKVTQLLNVQNDHTIMLRVPTRSLQ